MKLRYHSRAALSCALGSTILVGGCSLGTVGTADRVAEGTVRDASRYMDESRQPLPAEHMSTVTVSNDVYTSGLARRSDHGEPLPRMWEREGAFVLSRATLMPLYEIGTEITDVTRIPVSFAPDVTQALDAATSASTAATSNVNNGGSPGAPSGPNGPLTQGRMGGGDINSLLGSMGLSSGSTSFSAGNTAGAVNGMIRPLVGTRYDMKVDFRGGRLSQFLNEVGAHFNVSWEYTGGEIRIFRNVTRTYTVHALPSSIDLHSTLSADSSTSGGSGGDTAGATGGSNQKVNSSVTVEIWKDISSAVKGIVGSYGEVSTAVSTGTITVTAPPQIISRVQAYLDGQNARLNKQVAVSVQVLNVAITDSDNYSLDLQAVLTQGAKYGVTLASPTTAVPSAAGMFGYSVVNPNSTLNGTKAIASALSVMGRVSVRTTASVTTLNGVPAPLQIANTRGYIQSESVSNYSGTGGTGGATSQTQLNTSTVTTGFSLSLLPRIDADGNGLLMQFGINISDLNGATNGFDNFTTPDGTETVQLPNINSRNFVQQAFLPNGSTLVLAGFEQNTHSGTKSGVGNAGFLGLGGAQSGSAERDIVVILMTPTILSNTAPVISAE